MRRLVLLAGVLIVPVLTASPAHAVDNVICVDVTGACDQSAGTIALALSMASGNGKADTIRFAGPQADGPYNLNGLSEGLVLTGVDATAVISLPPGPIQSYLTVVNATVRSLTVVLNATTSSNDTAIVLGTGGVADQVSVDGSGADNAVGISSTNGTVTSSSILMDVVSPSGTSGIRSSGGTTVLDTVISGATGFSHSGAAADTLDRLTMRVRDFGVSTDTGAVNIADSVIDLGVFAGSGLLAGNFNNGTGAKAVNADHVTIVGGGAGSEGAWAFAAASGAQTTATVTLTNSILRGQTSSVVADAGNNGAQGGPSTATVNVSHTDYTSTGGTIAPTTGAGGVSDGGGNLIGVDPAFVDTAAGDYRLTPGSPVVDKGNPAGGGPALDRDGTARVVDGDAVPGAVRDMGAYELHDSTAPDTTIGSGPSGPTSDSAPTFAFSSEAGATFECQVDAAAYAACTSPLTTAVLADGAHSFSVRASDAVPNTDATPATRSFVVDTKSPDTSITSGPTGPTADATPTFAFSSEAGATFECRVDAAAYTACTSPLTTAALAEGAHTFSVRASDAVANSDATAATRSFSVDTTAPETTITKSPKKRFTVAKAKVRFSSEAGASFQCQVDKGAWRACASPAKLTVKKGKHTFSVRAVDAVGNVDPTPATVAFKRVAKTSR